MIFMSDRLSVAFSFSRRAHLITTCKAGGGITPVGQARALFTKRLLAAFPEGGQAMSQANIPCAVGSIFCNISKTMRWHIATPSRHLAREFVVALPIELSEAQWEKLLSDFIFMESSMG